ncbi:unnamed protein product, partial [Adineta ricciae]
MLDCQCQVTIKDIYQTIRLAKNDTRNFHPIGNGLTRLNETGMETMITLLQYFEDSLLKCIESSEPDSNLYRTVIEQKKQDAPPGSPEDLKWRFALTSKEILSGMKTLLRDSIRNVSLPLVTNDHRLITKRSTKIV